MSDIDTDDDFEDGSDIDDDDDDDFYDQNLIEDVNNHHNDNHKFERIILLPQPIKKKKNDDDDDDDKNKEKEKTKIYEIIHERKVYKTINKDIKNLQKYLFIDYFSTYEILKFFNWNFEKVINVYFDKEKGKEYVYEKIGLDTWLIHGGENEKKIIECPVCLNDVVEKDTMKISKCGHCFCKECFINYLKTQTNENGYALKGVKCIQMNCKSVLNERIIENVLKNSNEEFIVKNYISSNKKVKYCPSPNCSFLSKLIGDNSRNVYINCECGSEYCFCCRYIGNHFPSTCKQIEDWDSKVKQELASLVYMEKNCKKCPNCSMLIFKNGNMMKCQSCGNNFCWVCLNKVGYIHNCVFRSNITEIDEEKNKKVVELDKTSYFGAMKRWDIINQSLRLDGELMFENKWIIDCHKMLLKGRKIILNSIVFHYYSFNTILYRLQHAIDVNIKLLMKLKYKKGGKQKKKKNKNKHLGQTGRKTKINKALEENKKNEEIINQIKVYKNLFLFHLEQLEEKVEKLSNFLCNYPVTQLKDEKKKICGIVDIIITLFDSIEDTISKKDTFYFDDYS